MFSPASGRFACRLWPVNRGTRGPVLIEAGCGSRSPQISCCQGPSYLTVKVNLDSTCHESNGRRPHHSTEYQVLQFASALPCPARLARPSTGTTRLCADTCVSLGIFLRDKPVSAGDELDARLSPSLCFKLSVAQCQMSRRAVRETVCYLQHRASLLAPGGVRVRRSPCKFDNSQKAALAPLTSGSYSALGSSASLPELECFLT